ncbi:MAG: peptidoglycan-binding protein [Desulfobulbaceae bacterium]|nr:peptidoglycan-binding protein [Desulfobulbaceae bacterium]
MLTTTQKKTAEAIINIFETSEVLGNYSLVTLISGDTGHLTYGRSQTTLGSGNLYTLLQRYCENPGARFSARLEPSLPRFSACDLSLDNDLKVHNLLRASADDPVMRETQDAFFDDVYWQRAARTAKRKGITSPLGVAVVYDSFVHGSWQAMSNRTTTQIGDVAAVGEQKWIKEYVATRRLWLASHSRADLRATVYRQDAFMRLIDQDHWALNLPLVVRDREISASSLAATPPGCFDGPQPGIRVLSLQSPMQRGMDVRLVQLGLSEADIDIKADGFFGQTSVRLLKKYQSAHGLPVTGVADVALIAQLTS